MISYHIISCYNILYHIILYYIIINYIEDRTCVAGQTCFLDTLSGQSLQAGDSIMILGTCGQGPTLARVAEGGLFSSDTSLSWEPLVMTSAGGKYRLCWCSSSVAGVNCNGLESFRTDVGTLQVVGASPLTQDRTCVSGRTCNLDNVLGEAVDSLTNVPPAMTTTQPLVLV